MVPPEIWEVFHPWIVVLGLPKTLIQVYSGTLKQHSFFRKKALFGRDALPEGIAREGPV